MDINSKVDHMDEELQLLKNEIKQVLLEVQEHVLNVQNPFGGTAAFAPQPNKQDSAVAAAPVAAPPPPPPAAPAPVAAAPVGDAGMGMGMGQGMGMQAPSAPIIIGGGGGSMPMGAMPAMGNMGNMGMGNMPGSAMDSAFDEEEDDGPGLAPVLDIDDDDDDDDEGPSLPPAPKRERVVAPKLRSSAKKKPKPDRRVRARVDVEEDEDDEDDEDEDVMVKGPSVGGEVVDELEFSDEDVSALKLPEFLPESMDLVTITGLLQWTSSVMRKVGKDHLMFLLELSERSGRINSHTREVLEAIVPLFDLSNPRGESLSVKQVVSMMAQLDGFLGNVSSADSRLLPFLLQDEMEVFPLIRP